MGRTILVVDDDPKIAAVISTLLKSEKYMIDAASNGQEALGMVRTNDYWLIISDIQMPRMSGLEFFQSLKDTRKDIPIILMTGFPQFKYARQALKLGAVALILKPFDNNEILAKVEQIRSVHLEQRSKETALKYMTTQSYELELTSTNLMKREIFYSITNYLAGQFVNRDDKNRLNHLKVALAIHEALQNAVEHGNLELCSSTKLDLVTDDLTGSFEEQVKERLKNPVYAGRKVTILFSRHKDRLELKIRDEGKGFDHSEYRESGKNGSVNGVSGRGMLIMNSGMDKVAFNDAGNEVTLTRFL